MFKKIRSILEVVVFGLLFFISPALYSQHTGHKYFKNYSYLEYDHHSQNWEITQGRNGLIYVANQGGVLIFDGASWRAMGIPDWAPVNSLAMDETGTVYIGGKNEIGFLAPGKKGILKYNSLCRYLPDKQKKFSNVWKVYAIGEKIFFDTSAFLFRWDSRLKQFIGIPRHYISFLTCGEKLFVRKKETGLEQILQMENHGLKTAPVPGGEIFSEKRVYLMLPYNNQKLLIGTKENGLYIHDGKTTTPFPTEVDDYLKQNEIYNGTRLSSGNFALATLQGGLVIITPHGGLKYIFDKSYGLQDNKIYHVFEDIQENLWLCLSNGISKIEYTSPISTYDERSNLSGLVLSVVKHRDKIHAGTINGLYYLESPLKFRLVPGVSGSCWSLCSIGDSILAATSEGVFQVRKSITQKVIDVPSYVLLPSKHHPGRTWCGTRDTLVVLSRENSLWRQVRRFENIGTEIKSIVEDKKGNIWLGTSTGIVFKIDFAVDINHPAVTRYDASHGLPGEDIYVAAAAGRVVFATPKGLYRFDEKTRKFIPAGTLGTQFANGSSPVFRLVEDQNKNIWFHSGSRNYRAVPSTGDSFTISSRPFRRPRHGRGRQFESDRAYQFSLLEQ